MHPPAKTPDIAAVVAQLAEAVGQLQKSHRPAGLTTVSTGSTLLDQVLPGGGLQRGSLVEWLATGPGSGATTLALLAAGSGLSVRRNGSRARCRAIVLSAGGRRPVDGPARVCWSSVPPLARTRLGRSINCSASRALPPCWLGFPRAMIVPFAGCNWRPRLAKVWDCSSVPPRPGTLPVGPASVSPSSRWPRLGRTEIVDCA